MTNDWIYEKANALVRKHFTRDPFELAKDLNIHLEVMNTEKLHFFKTPVIGKRLKKALIGDNMKLLNFSADLWDTYLDELTRSSRYSVFP